MIETEGRLPPVDWEKELRPAAPGTADRLTYPYLLSAVERHEQQRAIRLAEVENSEAGSMVEQDARHELGAADLVCTAGKVVSAQTPEEHDAYARQFTQSSIALFGEPEADEALRLMRKEYQWLESLREHPQVDVRSIEHVQGVYAPLIGDVASGSEEDESQRAVMLGGLEAVLRDRYQPLFNLLQATALGRMVTPRMHEGFAAVSFAWLARYDDPSWSAWYWTRKDDVSLYVYGRERRYDIGMQRLSEPLHRALATNTHELNGGHALRANNGFRTGIPILGEGLPGYQGFDEGWATILGHAIEGRVAPGAPETYVNVALALGKVSSQALRRQELLELSRARVLARLQAAGEYSPGQDDLVDIRAYSRVNRIFRGGRGDGFGDEEAVLTRDIFYHGNYEKAARLVLDRLRQGYTIQKVFDYLSQGLFDPTIPEHAAFVDRHL